MNSKLKKFENILVLPWESKYKWVKPVGGPIYPEWDSHVDIRHIRCGETWDTYPTELPNLDNIETYHGEVYYGGNLKEHFGHFIQEYLSRCVKYKNLIKRNVNAKLCLTGDSNQTWDTIPSYIKEILNFFGFDKTNVLLVNKPLICKKLFTTPQEEYLGKKEFTSLDYIDILDKNFKPKPKKERSGMFFISRKNVSYDKGGLLGESYIEELLKKLNYKIIYPEKISVREQIEIYSSASKLIFVEGSAIHGLQLLGRNEVDVTIFSRRKDEKFALGELSPRVSKLNYIDVDSTVHRIYRRRDKTKFLTATGGAKSFGIPAQGQTKNFISRISREQQEKINFSIDELHERIIRDYKKYVNYLDI
jgi:hypothetical protein